MVGNIRVRFDNMNVSKKDKKKGHTCLKSNKNMKEIKQGKLAETQQTCRIILSFLFFSFLTSVSGKDRLYCTKPAGSMQFRTNNNSKLMKSKFGYRSRNIHLNAPS